MYNKTILLTKEKIMYCKKCGAQIPDDSPNMLCDACAQAEQQAEQHEKQQDFVQVAQVAPAQPKKKDIASLIIGIVGFAIAIIIYMIFCTKNVIFIMDAINVNTPSQYLNWVNSFALDMRPYGLWSLLPLLLGIAGIIVSSIRGKTHDAKIGKIFSIITVVLAGLVLINAFTLSWFLPFLGEYFF